MRSHVTFISAVILGLILSIAVPVLTDDRAIASWQVIQKSDSGTKISGSGQDAFVGLWQALDSSDGSIQFLSLTCAHRRSCDVRLNDTTFTKSCQNQIGFAQGEGEIRGLVLKADMTLFCSNLDGTSTEAGSQVNEFVLDGRNGTLTNNNDDNLQFPNVFHKISQ